MSGNQCQCDGCRRIRKVRLEEELRRWMDSSCRLEPKLIAAEKALAQEKRIHDNIIDAMEAAFGQLGQETDGMSSYEPLETIKCLKNIRADLEKEKLQHLTSSKNFDLEIENFKRFMRQRNALLTERNEQMGRLEKENEKLRGLLIQIGNVYAAEATVNDLIRAIQEIKVLASKR